MKACFVTQDVNFSLEREEIRERENREEEGAGGDYLRQVIILNILVKGGHLLE